MSAHNIRALITWGIVIGIGFSFGGQTGIGIALVIVLLVQIFG